MRLGIDWGGTKIEIIALDDDGDQVLRERVPTPKGDYEACVNAAANLVLMAEEKLGRKGTVGVGIPGSISPTTGLVRNSNSLVMNGKPLKDHMEQALDREVRIQNDANCFAVSEAVDGAAAGMQIVSGIIIGTGCGSGIAIEGKALGGRDGIAGEFGHISLAPMLEDELPGEICWCGRKACMESYVAGPAFQKDYDRRIGHESGLSARKIIAEDNDESRAAYKAYVSRLARGLATLTNIIDPNMFVLGGGMSNIEGLYRDLPEAMAPYVFSDNFQTPIVKAKHGDSSGVRGAAWLW